MYNYQPAEITDFSGGMTDEYVNGKLTSAEEMENFRVLNNRSIKTRPGTVVDSETDAQIPLGTQRVQTLVSYDNGRKLFVHSGTKLYYRNPTNYASLLGPSSNNPFPTATANTYAAFTQWNRHLIFTPDNYDLPVKVYIDGTGTYRVRTAGLPALANAPSPSGALGAQSYVYAFCYFYEYEIDDETFQDLGPTTVVDISNVLAPNSSSITIGSIPVISNGSSGNYDTSNIKVHIYRTTSGGTTFFKVGEVTNGTTSFVDNVSDTTIQNNQTIYTTGGVPDNDPPPLAKYGHTVNGKTYYAGLQGLPNDVMQSQENDPDSVPGSFRDTLEDATTGLSSVQDIPIVGCKKHIYRIDGAFDQVGRGAMVHRRISDYAGCRSHESFVQAEGGLFWFGNDGIYYTEGFRCQKVTDHLNKRYADFMATLAGNDRKVKGAFNEAERMIVWTISTTAKASGQEECDAIWCLDLQWGISDETTSYVWLGGDSFKPTSIVVHDGEVYRGDKLGYVLRFDDEVTTDPKIDTSTTPDNWFKESIRWKWRSVATNFGTSFVRKIANKVLLSAKNETNVSIAITAINDDGKLTRSLTPIRVRKNFIWGDEEFVWGSNDFVWSYGGTIEVDRRFPAKGLRFNYLQLEITNDFSNIVNSDAFGEAVVDPTGDTVTLVSGDSQWLQQSVDYQIFFEFDNYTNGFVVTDRTDDTLTVSDINNRLQSGTYKWQLKGYKKDEILNLVGLSLSVAQITRSFDTSNTGENGGLSGV